ncbi:hypothetical protein V6Z11_D04G174500 [Gossypium hirsutum]
MAIKIDMEKAYDQLSVFRFQQCKCCGMEGSRMSSNQREVRKELSFLSLCNLILWESSFLWPFRALGKLW